MYFQYIFIGIFAGILSGILGIGGGTVIIPSLVFLYNFSQHQAQGASLMLTALPVGILTAVKYYKEGNLNLSVGLLIATGFFIGGYFGAVVAHKIPDAILKKIFGIYLLIISIKMFISK